MSSVDDAQPETIAEEPGFKELGITGSVLSAIRDLGYETPSPIQRATIPTLLSGRDVVGMAQTGTGKTAAFALPILERLDVNRVVPQALVLAPTRELALQVAEAFESYAAQMPDVRLLPVYGGQGYGVQLSALRRGVHIVVGTPGRIMDHLAKGTLDLSELDYLVLDEADEMLKMGFAEDVEQILSQTPEEKQVALFSATMPPQIRRIAQQYLRDPEEISVKSKTATNANITQRYLVVSYAQKVDALTRILEVENFDGMIVFVRTKNETETLAEKLRARGYSAAAINGDIPQNLRERTVNQLKEAKLDILVATDVAARGLDVERVSHVVNFDIPTDTESYVHRIGRTGRAGRTGDAISFITPRERYLLGHIEKATRQQPTQMQLPTAEDVNTTRLARFDDAITAALEDTGRLDTYRDVIAHYVRHHDVPEADVAAALAIVAQGDKPLLLEAEDDRLAAAVDAAGRPPRERAGADRGTREARPARRGRGDYEAYRIEVGRRHRVEPRQIVGALANEGGLGRDDFGAITIRPEFSIVELPASLDRRVLEKLRDTRISGKLIEIRPDRGAPGRRRDGDRGFDRRASRDDRPARESRAPRDERSADDDRPARKPRHRKD
ncbi:DEAD/DEAH box helicase [Microbacterium sp.]|uniref:DEAD/DEAH box helicase n=1 Tax=Microbacterium sp. TaxID=51671 RepID=UPI002811884E|nr:DEAD/DEAH box helicase [Microbacterium sp.]